MRAIHGSPIRMFAVAAAIAGCASRPATVRTTQAPDATTIAAAPDQYFTVGTLRLRYREIGRGSPVVMLHGLMRSLEDWQGLGDSLATQHHVIVLDQRGHGRSTRVTSSDSLGAALADDVARLLDHLHVQRAHIVGQSMGSAVAMKFAARYPQRVASVSLLAPPSYPDSATFARTSESWAVDLEQGRGMTAFLRWLFPQMSEADAANTSAQALAVNPPATVAAYFRSRGALMITESDVAAMRTPALIVVGTGDPLRPQGRWLAARWPNAHLIEVSADHGSVPNAPEVLPAIRLMTSTGRMDSTAGAKREY